MNDPSRPQPEQETSPGAVPPQASPAGETAGEGTTPSSEQQPAAEAAPRQQRPGENPAAQGASPQAEQPAERPATEQAEAAQAVSPAEEAGETAAAAATGEETTAAEGAAPPGGEAQQEETPQKDATSSGKSDSQESSQPKRPTRPRRQIRVGYQAADLKAGLARPRPVHPVASTQETTKESEEPQSATLGQPATEAPSLPPRTRPRQTQQHLESPASRRGRRSRAPQEPPAEVPLEPEVPAVPLEQVQVDLPEDLEQEIEAALAGQSLNPDLVQTAGGELAETDLKGRQRGRILSISAEDVFVDLGRRHQGVLPLKQFDPEKEPPQVGQTIEVLVTGFDQEEGLYTLRLPAAGAEVESWDDLQPGTLVEATVTGQNKGGLECKVGHIRGFIPISQVALQRVDDLSPYLGQRLLCRVMEANPQRRNLVLSHRAVLEQQRAEARERLLAELAPGQVRTGKVVRIQPFGVFVDLGGVDGLVPISRMSWARISHPKQLVSEGDQVQVKVDEVDPTAGKVTLSMRDLMPNPWDEVASRYPVQSVVRGRVTRVADFGAFVELEPGVEGLLHISEISHRRVWRVSDHFKEGDEVEVEVIAVDPEKRRISLSRKSLEARAEEAAEAKRRAEKEAAEEEALEAVTKKKKKAPPQNLKGGLDRPRGGEVFGLKW